MTVRRRDPGLAIVVVLTLLGVAGLLAGIYFAGAGWHKARFHAPVPLSRPN